MAIPVYTPFLDRWRQFSTANLLKTTSLGARSKKNPINPLKSIHDVADEHRMKQVVVAAISHIILCKKQRTRTCINTYVHWILTPGFTDQSPFKSQRSMNSKHILSLSILSINFLGEIWWNHDFFLEKPMIRSSLGRPNTGRLSMVPALPSTLPQWTWYTSRAAALF